MKDKISYWQKEVERLKAIDLTNLSDDEKVDIVLDLEEARAQLNYAWQDDELDSLGLPHPWGY